MNIKKVLCFIEKNQMGLIYFGILISMLILNFITPYVADDLTYQYIWGTSNKVHNVWDVLVSQYNHYMTWGGRSVAHTIAQFFLVFPKFVFNIANSLCYVGILYKINSIATNKKKCAWLILFMHLLLFFITPCFGEDFLWLIGSCNYSWTILIMLIFLDYFHKEKLKDSRLSMIKMYFLGILAGWTNENTGIALVIIVFLILGNEKILKKKKLPMWKITGWIGSIVGYIILLLSPGNYIRNSYMVDDTFFLIRYLNNFMDITDSLIKYLWPLLIGLLVLYTYYIYQKKKPDAKSVIYGIGGLVATYAMIASPYFPERAWSGIIVFLVIAIINLFENVYEKQRLVRFIFFDCMIILSIFFIRDYSNLARDLIRYNKVIYERKQYIKKHPKEEIYYFEAFPMNNKYSPFHGYDLTENPDSWQNDAEAKRHGVKKIIGYW